MVEVLQSQNYSYFRNSYGFFLCAVEKCVRNEKNPDYSTTLSSWDKIKRFHITIIVEKRATWVCIIRPNWTTWSCFADSTFPDLNQQTNPNFESTKHVYFIVLMLHFLFLKPSGKINLRDVFFTNNIWVIFCFLRILFNRIWPWLREWGILRCYFLWYVDFYRHDFALHYSLCFMQLFLWMNFAFVPFLKVLLSQAYAQKNLVETLLGLYDDVTSPKITGYFRVEAQLTRLDNPNGKLADGSSCDPIGKCDPIISAFID